MYELLIRLYYELDYRKYKIEDLKEMREILKQFEGDTIEVRLKKEKENGNYFNKRRNDI